MINYILGTLQPDTDLAMVGYPFTDEFSHQFMGLVTPTDATATRTRATTTSRSSTTSVHRARNAHRVAIREGYIRSAYAEADEKLGSPAS